MMLVGPPALARKRRLNALSAETDAKLHKHAGIGLMMCRRPDLTVPQAARLAARESRRREGWPNHI